MEKLIKALLEDRFPDVESSNLLTVINATPNPVIATEILTGLYEYPEVPETTQSSLLLKRYHSPKFKSFDPLRNEVSFEYRKRKSREDWLLKDRESDPAFEDEPSPIAKHYWYAEAAVVLGLSIDEFKQKYERITIYDQPNGLMGQDDTSLDEWLRQY